MPNSVLGHWSFRTFECVFIFLQHSLPLQWACWFHLHVKCRRVFRHRLYRTMFQWLDLQSLINVSIHSVVCLFLCYPDHVAYNNFTDSLFYIVFMKSFISDKESMTPSSINDCWKKLWLSGMFIKVRKLIIFANKSIHFVDMDKLFRYTNLVIFFFSLKSKIIFTHMYVHIIMSRILKLKDNLELEGCTKKEDHTLHYVTWGRKCLQWSLMVLQLIGS